MKWARPGESQTWAFPLTSIHTLKTGNIWSSYEEVSYFTAFQRCLVNFDQRFHVTWRCVINRRMIRDLSEQTLKLQVCSIAEKWSIVCLYILDILLVLRANQLSCKCHVTNDQWLYGNKTHISHISFGRLHPPEVAYVIADVSFQKVTIIKLIDVIVIFLKWGSLDICSRQMWRSLQNETQFTSDVTDGRWDKHKSMTHFKSLQTTEKKQLLEDQEMFAL